MTRTAPRILAARAPASLVLEVPPAAPEAAHRHYAARLSVETDPSDVRHDLDAGVPGLVIADTRLAADYAGEHVAGAVSLPYRELTETTTRDLSRDSLYVTYGWDPGCNAGSKGAARLAELGFRVKEMIGGLEYWKRNGHPTESGG